jgi:class 3 adenylate cyclase
MALPTGPAVTFLFTDIEGSTRLERAVGTGEWARLVARHDTLIRSSIEAAKGVVVKTEGDAFFAAFGRPAAAAAAAAAVAAQRAIAGEAWPADAATKLLDESAAIPLAPMVEEVLGAPPPGGADQLAGSGADSAG